MTASRQRLSVLIGSASAFSPTVLIGIGIVGFFLSFMYIRLIPEQSVIVTFAASAGAALLSVGVLILARERGNRDGWTRSHAGIVLGGLVVASLVRSLANLLFVAWQTSGREWDSGALSSALAALVVTLVLGVVMVASAQLSRERADANAGLLAEQARLRALVESADLELVRSEAELRARARVLLEPTINEIRELISEEISEADARQLSDRINAAVNDVVRPASRELARSPRVDLRTTVYEPQAPLAFFKDRMDITQAIRPGWLLALSWGLLLPAALILGASTSSVGYGLVVSLLGVALLAGIKAAWPRAWRVMPIVLGFGVLVLLYSVVNLAFMAMASSLFATFASSAAWESNNLTGIIVRVALAMLVSVLATLLVHGEQLRAGLAATNVQLEELIARLRRETWLMHRSVSLAVHGTVQSALISTSMRLTAADRDRASIEDARRRLEDALSAIASDQGHSASLEVALDDLRGLWHPIVQLSHTITPAAELRLAEDAGLSRCVIEICREATSNAIRHGKATLIDITIGMVGDLVEIRIDDNGDGLAHGALPGLGTQMLDETCFRWHLAQRPGGGSELIALLA
jgi:hypothetical protein